MEEPITKLVNEFSSLIDEALILSICNDYDLSKPEDLQQARQALLIVSENVPLEEASGFNASGLSTQYVVNISDVSHDDPEESRSGAVESDLRSNDGLTTTTENSVPQSLLSTASSKTSTHDVKDDSSRLSLFDGLSADETESRLQEIFPELKRVDITLALQKFNGDADRAVEVLLTTAHLEQTGQRTKGVDGFYVDDDVVQSRRKKGKKKKAAVRANGSTNPSSANSSDESPAPEETHRRNIAYLAERLPFGVSEVEDIYYQKHKSMGASVAQILDNYIALDVDVGAKRSASAEEQAKKYPWVPATYMAPALSLGNTHQHALELIQILAEYYEKPAYLKYDVSYNITAPKLEIDTVGKDANKSWSAVARSRGTTSPIWNSASSPLSSPALGSSDLSELRNYSFQAAGAAYKKGGLYRSAAAVLSERGRELTKDLHYARSSEAASYVDQRSRPDLIDLHGVTVQDGVGIALDRVWRWWENLGEERARRAREGFTIVTGLGRHSAGGVSRLRINVFKALVADGWKVTVLTGQYLVTGRK